MEGINEKRLENLRKGLKEIDISSYLVTSDENIFYLTGFYGKDSGSILIITPSRALLMAHFVHARNAEQSVRKSNIEVERFNSGKIKVLSKILEGNKTKKASIEGNNVSYNFYVEIEKELEQKGIKFENRPGIVESMRIKKDSKEILALKKACSITQKAFKAILNMDKEKLLSFTQRGLAFDIEGRMIEHGSEGNSFDLIVAPNSSAALPHYEPSRQKIPRGLLLLDIGCRYNNYCSDMTRTIFISGNDRKNLQTAGISKMMKIYDIVLQAQALALKACRAGITCRELDLVARKFIEDKGFGKQFGHGLGHGTGLQVHELPTVSFSEDRVLQEGMVITIEPGVYLDGIGGVRIEDMVLIKDGGYENMYNDDKSLLII
jgi:Xaa-Pro aminopeptidase